MEEHKLREFENRILRRIFGPKKNGMTGGWRKLHNEELHDLYSLASMIRIIKSKRMGWAGHVAQMGEKSHTALTSQKTPCFIVTAVKTSNLT
jgi:hypothetical protein